MRAFLAIEIDEKIKETVVKLIEKLSVRGEGISWVKKENIHLTLFFFENLKEEDVEKISYAVLEKAKQTEPFSLEVKGGGFFGRREAPKVFWLGFDKDLPALKKFQAEIADSFKNFGYLEDKRFAPHLTIGRNRTGKKQNYVVSTLLDYKDFSLGTFLVEGVVLFKSELLKGGALHTPIKKFTLGEKIDKD